MSKVSVLKYFVNTTFSLVNLKFYSKYVLSEDQLQRLHLFLGRLWWIHSSRGTKSCEGETGNGGKRFVVYINLSSLYFFQFKC